MKIDINRIPLGGLVLSEQIPASSLDLETEIIKFRSPLRVKAEVSRITNAVTVHLDVVSSMCSYCSRCLEEFDLDLKKKIDLNYSVSEGTSFIDLNPDIREEIILDYSIKPLCKPSCKGLCPKCGKNLNEGKCNC